MDSKQCRYIGILLRINEIRENRMSMKWKMVAVLIAIITLLAIAYFGVFRLVVLKSFSDLDLRFTERNMHRCMATFDRELKHLDKFVHDWASWDDTCQFIMDGNESFSEDNFTWSVFEDQRLNLIHVYNTKGKLVWGKTYDLETQEEIALSFSSELNQEALQKIISQPDPDKKTTGIVHTKYGALMFASRPVLTSDNKGPSRGAFVMGRFIDELTKEEISEQVNVTFNAWSVNARLPVYLKTIINSLIPGYDIKLVENPAGTMKAYALMRDIEGEPAMIFEASMPREIMQKGLHAYRLGLAFLLFSGIALLLAVSIVTHILVIRPITRLTGNILSVGKAVSATEVFDVHRKDELGTLSREFEAMVHRLADHERDLEFGEKRLRQIIDLVPHYIFAKDLDGSFVLVNKAFADNFGLTPQEMTGLNVRKLVYDHEKAQAIYEEDTEVVSSGTSRHIIKDAFFDAIGSNRYVQTTKIPFISSDISKPAVLGVSVDITEIKLAEEALRQSQRMLVDLIDFLPDATFAVDCYGKILAWNRAMEKISGINKDDLRTMDYKEYGRVFYGEARPVLLDLIFEDREDIRTMYDFVVKDGEKYISESYAPNLYQGRGAYIWAIAAPFYDSSGNIVGAIECIRDITDRKKAEEVLRRHSETIEQLLDGVVMSGLDGTVHYINPSWATMHGYTSDEILGKHLRVFHTEDQMITEVTPFLEELLSEGSCRAKLGHISKDGTIFTTLTSAFILKDTRGDPTAIIGIARDITEELKMENQLRQAQKMEVVGRLAGGVAHDLNNMLSPVLGYAEIVLTELPEDNPSFDHVVQIKTAAERARNLTHELLAFSRKQVLDMKIVDLAEVVASYGKMLRRTIREDISIQIRQSLSRGVVRVDIGQVGQVLMNLAVNAADAMPKGGSITIDIGDIILDESYAQTHQGVMPGEYVVMSFSDTGLGINPKIMEHIFEPFFTTKERGKGTGLGLATVYGIIRQHGGHISVYSETGMGTTFKVYLPCIEGTSVNLFSSSRVTEGKRGKETVVVAEDDAGVRELTCDILQKHGYKIITAGNSEELLKILEEKNGSIDLLLTDVIMPDMNGRELYLKLRENRPDLKVLYMSGYTDDVIAYHGILEEGVQLIQKPFSISSLTEKMRLVLDA